MAKFNLDRRAFLRDLAACLLLPAAIPEKALEATEVPPEVWREMEVNPVTFTVDRIRRIEQRN